jgi:excisionase family DNA binding protein
MNESVDDLLTTRQLQDLLQVDRITIYRMLNDGRLRGFKVGGQWRFSRREIDAWLLEQQARLDGSPPSAPPPEAGLAPSAQALPLSCIEAIQALCAEALGIATVTSDPDGGPLEEISNRSDFCEQIRSTEIGRRRCATSWTEERNQEIGVCHAGLCCVTAPIRVSGQLVAMAAGCQFVAEPSIKTWAANLGALAFELGLDEEALRAGSETVHVVPEDTLPRIARLLRQMADTFSEIGQERLNLLSRLQHIAEMSRI